MQEFAMDEILGAPHITYPIYVDPEWNSNRVSYLYVDSYWPTTSYWNGNYTDASVHVGFLPAAWDYNYKVNHITRGFYQFNTAFLAGKSILSGKLNTTEVYAPSCTPRAVSAWYTGDISTSTAYGSQPVFTTKLQTQTVAHGNSASCPAATVGFDLAAVKAKLATDSTFTVGLRADNESDSLGWKRFSNAASLTVSYNNPPNTPGMWGMSYGRWTGTPWASAYLTRANNPVFDVTAGDADGGTLSVQFVVNNSASVKVDGTATNVSGTSGGHFKWQSKTLADGAYTLKAQTKDPSGALSGWMSFAFTIDTTRPTAPTIVPTSAYFDATTAHTDNAPDAVVGAKSYSFTIKDTGTYPATGYVYAVTSKDQAVTYPGTVTCGVPIKEFTVVCPSTAGAAITIQVAAVNVATTVTVFAFDLAGNINAQLPNATPATYSFTVNGTKDLSALTVLPVTLRGGSWNDVLVTAGVPSSANTPESCVGNSPGSVVGQSGTVLQTTASGQYADTGSVSAVNTATSFSISGWVCSTQPVSTARQSLITQMASAGSPGGSLGISAAGMPELSVYSGASAASVQKVTAGTALTPNTWMFLSAVYDGINRQLRLTMSDQLHTSTWTVAATATAPLATQLNQPVMLGAQSAAGVGQFKGQLMHPVMVQGVLAPDQFNLAQTKFYNDDGDPILAGVDGVMK